MSDTTTTEDREPQPTDGPDYHEDHAAWEERQKFKEKLRTLRFGTVPGGYKDKNG